MDEWTIYVTTLVLCGVLVACLLLNVWLAVQLYLARVYPNEKFDALLGAHC